LRFVRRGIVGSANNEGSDNNMQFFFTLDQTPELQSTHTIFGKVSGETIYNMIKLNEMQTDANERPLFPHKINKVKILNNPFPDIEPRVDRAKSSNDDSKDRKKKDKREGVKNFKLISFGDEAEQDEMETVEVKIKKPDVQSTSSTSKQDKKEKSRKRSNTPPKQTKPSSPKQTKSSENKKPIENDEDSGSDYEISLEKEKRAEVERKKKEIQDQIKEVKQQYQKEKKEKSKPQEVELKPQSSKQENDAIQSYLDEKEKYKQMKMNKKGAQREDFTLKLLERFKSKLHSVSREITDDNKKSSEVEEGENVEDDDEDKNWLAHKLDFSEVHEEVIAKDASTKNESWYEIFDPRNPLNKRKREGKPHRGDEKRRK
jgi:peptidyl-prolyl cis-trans isomerase SDCCAG10